MSAQVADASKYTLILYAVYVREEETYEDESPKKKKLFLFFYDIFRRRSLWGSSLEAYRVTHMA